MQASWLRSLIQKDSTCRQATRLLCHNYSAYAGELRSHIYLAYKPQLLKSACIEPMFHLLPSIFPSIRVFSNEFTRHIRWPKYWSFSISPSNEYSGSISLKNDWLDLLAVLEGSLSVSLQHHNSKASILHCSAFFMVQFSHLYTTTAKRVLFFPLLFILFWSIAH